MSKEKQIEEMAKVMAYGRFVEPNENQIRLFIGEAESLYNADYRKQSKWISVDERLPERTGWYLIFTILCEIDLKAFLASSADNRGTDGFTTGIRLSPIGCHFPKLRKAVRSNEDRKYRVCLLRTSIS